MPEADDILIELAFLVDNEPGDTLEVSFQLTELAQSVIQGGKEVREKVLALGAYDIVCRAWQYYCEADVSDAGTASGDCVDSILRALYALTIGFPDIFDTVGWQIIGLGLDKSNPESTLINTLQLLRNLFIKSEGNREHFSWNLGLLQPFLTLFFKPNVTLQLVSEWCLALKALTLNDDVRVAYNRAAERKQSLAKAKILPILADLLRQSDYEEEVITLNSVVILLESMVVSDEMRLQMDAGNILSGIHAIFRNHSENKALIKNTVSLLRLLNISQKLRDKTGGFALMKWIVNLLEKYKGEMYMVEELMSCCSYMTLKNPCQVAQFIAKNGLSITHQLMKDFSDELSIVKPICFTLRNVAENGGGYAKEKIIELGYESILSDVIANAPGLEQFYVSPILKEIKTSDSIPDSPLYDAFEVPILEPPTGRQSVIIDDPDENE